MIDGGLYVDGGVTGNIIYGGRGAEEDTIPGIWGQLYPNVLMPKLRMWVIFNNQFRPVPELTAPNWPAVIQRSLETVTRASTATAVRHLFTMAQVSRLKRKVDIEVRVVSIPGDWYPAGGRNFRERDHEQSGRSGRKNGRRSGELEQRTPGVLTEFDETCCRYYFLIFNLYGLNSPSLL
jgi:hypothetical protein